ncbi:RimK family protein [Desulfobulbus propionicus]
MNAVLIILDSLAQWAPYYRTESVITAGQYLQNDELSHNPHLVINLCSDLGYHSEGYYCSLLAQARRHKVIPSIDDLNKLESNSYVKLDNSLGKLCQKLITVPEANRQEATHLDIFFGQCEDSRLDKIARFIFDQYPCPMLRVTISKTRPALATHIRRLTLDELDDRQQTLFADNLDRFSKKVWRQPRRKISAQYDMAILHDPEEKFPPSNRAALNLFLAEAKKMHLNAELLTEHDSARLMEFDALFIRQTTAVNHVTYQLAQKAQQADMVVIDDPASIIRCTNKVFLKELLDREMIPAPNSKLLFKGNPSNYQEVTACLGEAMVIKIPDGSFSIGVSRIRNEKEYNELLEKLFQRSAILLAQEFVPTEYDWRIGVLNGECVFACKYFMARGHWQIYQHKSTGSTRSGRVETLPVHQVPRQVLRMAVRVSSAIGKGFYGVDIKMLEKKPVVIEVNDNPSVDHGIEDAILGNELYRMILREFVARLNKKRRSA